MIQSSLFHSSPIDNDDIDAEKKVSADRHDEASYHGIEHIALPDADLSYLPRWLCQSQSQQLFNQLKREVEWQQSDITLYGKKMTIPRLNAWYGNSGCGYVYSNTYFEPLPFLPLLEQLIKQVEIVFAQQIETEGLTTGSFAQGYFNSALVNCYRDGQDSVAWHSDDEPELGQNPLVASLSLGDARVFRLKHRGKKSQPAYKMLLSQGDLLLMHGTTQHHWQHEIPKTNKCVGERINITFRRIQTPRNAE